MKQVLDPKVFFNMSPSQKSKNVGKVFRQHTAKGGPPRRGEAALVIIRSTEVDHSLLMVTSSDVDGGFGVCPVKQDGTWGEGVYMYDAPRSEVLSLVQLLAEGSVKKPLSEQDAIKQLKSAHPTAE